MRNLIFLVVFTSITASRFSNRDDSGMITLRDIVKVSDNMCTTLARLNKMLKGSIFKTVGVSKLINGMVTPIPNPSAVVDPLGVWKYSSRLVFASSRFLTGLSELMQIMTPEQVRVAVRRFYRRNIEKNARINCTEIFMGKDCEDELDQLKLYDSEQDMVASLLFETLRKDTPNSVYNNPGDAFLTLGNLINGSGVVCKQVRQFENIFDGDGFLGFIKFGNTWIPVRDKRYPVNYVRLMDPWGLREIPKRIYENVRGGIKGLVNVLSGRKNETQREQRQRFWRLGG